MNPVHEYLERVTVRIVHPLGNEETLARGGTSRCCGGLSTDRARRFK